MAAGILASAPARITEALLAAFQAQALYNNHDHQVTIRATLTDDTPRTIAALLADPRTDDDSPAGPAPSHDAMSHLGTAPIPQVMVHNRGPHMTTATRPPAIACRRAGCVHPDTVRGCLTGHWRQPGHFIPSGGGGLGRRGAW
jgi:hypothetical protein